MSFIITIFLIILAGLYGFEQLLPLFFLSKKRSRQKNPSFTDLTVIIPVKNEELILEKTLRSWLNLKYPGRIELLLADAYSTDKTAEIARYFAQKHAHIKYLRLKTNNKYNTLRQAIKKSSYEWIVISDADRIVYSQALTQLVPYLNAKVGAVFGMAKIVRNDKPFQKLTTLEFVNIMTDMLFYSNVDSVPYLYLHSCIIRKSLVTDLPPQELIADDLYIGLHIRKKGYKTVFIPEVIVGEEQVVDFSDLLGKRLRTSAGTVEIARSNYLQTLLQAKYSKFGLLIIPYRQLTTIVVNSLTFITSIVIIVALFFQVEVLSFILSIGTCLYILLAAVQILRMQLAKTLFFHTTVTIPFWAILLYPFYYLVVRKWLSGFTFLASHLGVRFAWKKSTSDRK